MFRQYSVQAIHPFTGAEIAIGMALTLLFSLVNASAFAADSSLTDPTRPASMSVPRNTGIEQKIIYEYKLSQIYTSRKNRRAIVNGQNVKMGDWIENAQVIAIKANSVNLLIDGSIREIAIVPSIKQYKK